MNAPTNPRTDDMSEMVRRAAVTIARSTGDVDEDDAVPIARAALLAALDLSEAEQQQLFEDDAEHDGRIHNESVRATLCKLKAFAQGASVE